MARHGLALRSERVATLEGRGRREPAVELEQGGVPLRD